MSQEIREGMRVRVSGSSTRKLNGKLGRVTQTFGNPSYLAVEVAFDDGSSDLFWHHQVDNHENGTKAPGLLETLSDTKEPSTRK